MLADCPEKASKLKRGLIVLQRVCDLMLWIGLSFCRIRGLKVKEFNLPLLNAASEAIFINFGIGGFTIRASG